MPGDRVRHPGAWNTFRHVELYYAISGIGAVCHTINPRLFDDQIVYIVNHAADRLLFVDATFLPLVERLAPRLPADCRIVPMTEAEENMPATKLPVLPSLRSDGRRRGRRFRLARLRRAHRRCRAWLHPPGTTGHPKGALYSHRSTVLHAFGISLPGRDLDPGCRRCLRFGVVPLFHVCGWGVPYAAPMNGAKRVVARTTPSDGASLY